ncbi:MAG: glycosyltransferase family 2 protein [Rhodobacteraceae bacterium]|nr:glycosyltransferase family 2 protein [Paracoccaceae bacterium]
MPPTAPPAIHRRCLGALRLPGGPVCLEAVAVGRRVLAFFAAGSDAGAIRPAGGGRGIMVRGLGAGVVATLDPAAPAILGPAGPVAIAPVPAEPAILAGLDCALTVRLHEPAATVAEWLAFHVREHGLGGAVIVNRAPPAGAEEFALALAAALAEARVAPAVVLLETPLPLGRAGEPPAIHPVHAPEAPGKDRMTLPEADPWTAPMGELLVYEIARWRFLARAAGVINLDVSDLLAPRPAGAAGVFAAARAAPEGLLRLEGRLAYPWRIRPGARECHGDHVCRPFDRRLGAARWCLAPARLPAATVWLPVRVAGARAAAGDRPPFWRCMAIRHPGTAPAALAPKTSLVVDEDLVRLATGPLGARPVLPPGPALPAAGTAPAAVAARRTLIVTTMKNEGPVILEWIAYHRAIGVDDFLVYTNDCSDGTDRLLALLDARGIVRHRDNPYRSLGLPPQHAALQAAEDEAAVAAADWLICMDVDEFLCVKLGAGLLADLFAAAGEANMISLTWRLFGSGDVHRFEDRPVIEQFRRCAHELIRKPHHAWGFKTLFRNLRIYRKLGVHRPKGLKPELWDQIHWLNGSGRRMPVEMLRNGWRSTLATYGYDWASLNHYAVRSAESFLVKRDRGRVNHVDRDQGLNYWFRMNHNSTEDRSILRLLPATRAELARLTADPAIAEAHGAAVAAHRARIAELRATPAYAAFYGELTSARLERLARLHRHFGASVYAAGPNAIPDAIARADRLPADFFLTVPVTGDGEAAETAPETAPAADGARAGG